MKLEIARGPPGLLQSSELASDTSMAVEGIAQSDQRCTSKQLSSAAFLRSDGLNLSFDASVRRNWKHQRNWSHWHKTLLPQIATNEGF